MQFCDHVDMLSCPKPPDLTNLCLPFVVKTELPAANHNHPDNISFASPFKNYLTLFALFPPLLCLS